jgi:hypothetical protein
MFARAIASGQAHLLARLSCQLKIDDEWIGRRPGPQHIGPAKVLVHELSSMQLFSHTQRSPDGTAGVLLRQRLRRPEVASRLELRGYTTTCILWGTF